MNNNILSYLDCSTSHVTEKDMELLKETPAFLYDFTHASYEYGAFVSVSGAAELEEETRKMLEDGFSEAFINLRKYAEQHGCTILRLDAHGVVIEGLPTFEW